MQLRFMSLFFSHFLPGERMLDRGRFYMYSLIDKRHLVNQLVNDATPRRSLSLINDVIAY